MRNAIKIFLLLITTLLISCESKIDKAIPNTMLVGAVSNIDITFKGAANKCKEDSDDSIWIKAIGIVPFDIRREQVKPTLLAVLKATKNKYPHCEKMFIELAPDAQMAEEGSLVGRAEYEKEIVKLLYGIPSKQQIEEHNSKIGKPEPIIDGNIFEGKADFGKTEINDSLRYPPSKETFDMGKKIFLIIEDAHLRDFKAGKKFNYELAYETVAKKINLPVKEVKRYYKFMTSYYPLMGYHHGEEETMNLK